MTAKRIDAEEFDRMFDDGEDVSEFVEWEHPAVRDPDGSKRVNLNMPVWLVDVLDDQAKHLSVSRQAIANIWLAERAKQEGLV